VASSRHAFGLVLLSTVTPMEPHIVVRGTGQAAAQPDRAVVRVEVDGEGGSRDDAYREAAKAASAVDAVTAGHADAIARNQTAALVVHPKTRWRRGESVRTGWRGSRTTLLEVTDFAHLGELFGELAAAGGAVSGPYWHLDTDNSVHAEARRLAAEDARRRADTYASALGLRITGIAWIAEPGLREAAPPPFPVPVARAAALSLGEAPEEVIDVTPEEMTVDAAVDVGFAFESVPT
jgi:uncharacterized protein YggE